MRDWFLEVSAILRQIRNRPWISIALLLALTEAMYLPLSILTGRESLVGYDYSELHSLRIAFARNALFGPRHTLPTWYPSQLLGAPFSANLQNFPWIPTRLALLWLDPTLLYGVSIALAAALAALFTYLYGRRAGLSEIGSIAAAWTFACAGFFASRVEAGHLALLEAYPSLPLLLWLADRSVSADRAKLQARDLCALALASACVALAGHPQIPTYSLAAACLYLLWRGRGWTRIKALLSMGVGIGLTLFAWWPMFLLAGRSTRLLHLAEPSNDVVLSYRRVLALLWPGIDGWPEGLRGSEQHLFSGYPNVAYFWDTASYIGLLPIAVMLILLWRCAAARRLPKWPWSYLAALGLCAFAAALPLMQPLREMIPGIFLRSPARLLYLSTFCASLAFGFGLTIFLEPGRFSLRLKYGVVVACLIFHAFDLASFDRRFIHTEPRQQAGTAPFAQILSGEVQNARIATDWQFRPQYVERYDDVGIFDSILLANSYRTILALNGSPRDINEQYVDGSDLSLAALQGAGVRFVVTAEEKEDLKLVSETDEAYLYRVPDPAPRAAFFAVSEIDFLPGGAIPGEFASHPRSDRLLLPAMARRYTSAAGGEMAATTAGRDAVVYERPSSDEIRLQTSTEPAGFVEVLESYDPGWMATVDGRPASVLLANGYAMAVPLAPGRHQIRLWYETPGRTAGIVLSLISGCILAGLLAGISRMASA